MAGSAVVTHSRKSGTLVVSGSRVEPGTNFPTAWSHRYPAQEGAFYLRQPSLLSALALPGIYIWALPWGVVLLCRVMAMLGLDLLLPLLRDSALNAYNRELRDARRLIEKSPHRAEPALV